MNPELLAIKRRHETRTLAGKTATYDLRPENIAMTAEADARVARALKSLISTKLVSDLKILVVGCGYGGEVFLLLRQGIRPEQIYCVDLMADRCNYVREMIPRLAAVVAAPFTKSLFNQHFDLVLCEKDLSSIADPGVRMQLVDEMVSALSTVGLLSISALAVNSPNNPDVPKVPLIGMAKLRSLPIKFARRCTLAPPLSRFLSQRAYLLLAMFSTIPFLKTHRVVVVSRPSA